MFGVKNKLVYFDPFVVTLTFTLNHFFMFGTKPFPEGKHWWIIEYNAQQHQMHIEWKWDRSPHNPDWNFVEKFYGTMEAANRRANAYFASLPHPQQ